MYSGLSVRLYLLASLFFAFGCSRSTPVFANAEIAGEPQHARKVVQSASIELGVSDVTESAKQVENTIRSSEGYIETTTNTSDESVSMRVRVPSNRLKAIVGTLSKLGDLESSSFTEEDVTEQYSDLEASLANMKALRDRLRLLLDRATGVKDVLAIEEQLNRVQTELDQSEARFKLLNGRISLSTLQISLQKQHIPGPLGAVFQAVGWVVEKLFVLN